VHLLDWVKQIMLCLLLDVGGGGNTLKAKPKEEVETLEKDEPELEIEMCRKSETRASLILHSCRERFCATVGWIHVVAR